MLGFFGLDIYNGCSKNLNRITKTLIFMFDVFFQLGKVGYVKKVFIVLYKIVYMIIEKKNALIVFICIKGICNFAY